MLKIPQFPPQCSMHIVHLASHIIMIRVLRHQSGQKYSYLGTVSPRMSVQRASWGGKLSTLLFKIAVSAFLLRCLLDCFAYLEYLPAYSESASFLSTLDFSTSKTCLYAHHIHTFRPLPTPAVSSVAWWWNWIYSREKLLGKRKKRFQ